MDAGPIPIRPRRLNTLFVDLFGFQLITARKDHTDLFDVPMRLGDSYYKRQRGGAFDDVIKLSEKSMDRVCLTVFYGNNYLRTLTDGALVRETQRAVHVLNALPSCASRCRILADPTRSQGNAGKERHYE